MKFESGQLVFISDPYGLAPGLISSNKTIKFIFINDTENPNYLNDNLYKRTYWFYNLTTNKKTRFPDKFWKIFEVKKLEL